jgi:hypothetical protein
MFFSLRISDFVLGKESMRKARGMNLGQYYIAIAIAGVVGENTARHRSLPRDLTSPSQIIRGISGFVRTKKKAIRHKHVTAPLLGAPVIVPPLGTGTLSIYKYI